jgi:hypothetical protein
MKALITGLAVLLTVVVGVAGPASAAEIPGYFSFSNPSALCASVESTQVLVQINFDTFTFGGINLDTAEILYTQLGSIFPLLDSLIGPDVQITCSFSPKESAQIFGLNALQLAQGLSPLFAGIGFAAYVILDVYLWEEPEFLGFAPTLRVDVFIVNGDNDVTYLASASVLRSLVGL